VFILKEFLYGPCMLFAGSTGTLYCNKLPNCCHVSSLYLHVVYTIFTKFCTRVL